MMIYDEMSHLLLMYVTYPPIHICFKLMALKTSNKTIEFIFKSIFLQSHVEFFLITIGLFGLIVVEKEI